MGFYYFILQREFCTFLSLIVVWNMQCGKYHATLIKVSVHNKRSSVAEAAIHIAIDSIK